MKHEILELIQNRPNARTVEIADRLDMEPEQVRPLIADEIRKGVIVEEEIIAPNGRPVMSFRFASAEPVAPVVVEHAPNPFPARVLRALPPTERPAVPRARLMGKPAPTVLPKPAADPLTLALSPAHVAAAPAPELAQAADEPLDIDVTVTRKADVPLTTFSWPAPPVDPVPQVEAQPEPKPERVHLRSQRLPRPDAPKTRVDLALEFLSAAGGSLVSNANMRAAMGLGAGQAPSNFLKSAIKSGRVIRVGSSWGIGSHKPAAQALAQVEASAEKVPELAPAAAPRQEQAAQVEPEAPALVDSYTVPKFIGGSPNYPIPPVAEGAPEIDRPGLYENGEFHATPEEIMVRTATILSKSGETDTYPTSKLWNPGNSTWAHSGSASVVPAAPANDPAPAKFRAGVMSDGTLHLCVPGHQPLDLTPENARELYLFLRNVGYAAWPTAA